MTKLNPAQSALLDAVATAKQRTDIAVDKLKLEYENAVYTARGVVREAVGKAVYANVPDRRIGMALGTSDHKTIKSYYPEVDDASTD